MPLAVELGSAPVVGHKMTWSEMDYVVTKAHSLTLRDGTLYAEIYWENACPDCGASVKTRTGLAARKLPKRCKACNGPEDKDAIERRAYVKNKWVANMKEAKAAKRGEGPQPLTCTRIGMLLGLNEYDQLIFCGMFSDGSSLQLLAGLDEDVLTVTTLGETQNEYSEAAQVHGVQLAKIRDEELSKRDLFS
jgi:hypothetical protein